KLAHVVQKIRIVGDPPLVALEQRKISDVEAHQRWEQTPIGFGDLAADEITLPSEPRFKFVEGGEQGIVGRLIGLLRAGKPAAIDAVVNSAVDEIVDAIDFGAESRGVEIRVVARNA